MDGIAARRRARYRLIAEQYNRPHKLLPTLWKKPSVDEPGYSGTNESHFFHLPHELLSEVFSWIVDDTRWYIQGRFHCLCVLALTCKKFYAIATPLLYHHIDISQVSHTDTLYPPCPPETFDLIYRSLSENPHLRVLCRSFFLSYIGAMSRQSRITEFASWLTEVRSLTVFIGRLEVDIVDSIRDGIQTMHSLERIKIEGMGPFCTFRALQPLLDLPTVRKLKLVNTPATDYQSSIVNPEFELTEDKRGTAPFKSLEILGTTASPESIQNLASWARALVHFRCTDIATPRRTWTFETYSTILASQSQTLKMLDLGPDSIRWDTGGMIDLSRLPNVETLRISRYILCSPELAASCLGTRLRKLAINYAKPRVMYLKEWSHIGQMDADWVVGFSELQSRQRSALELIEIMCRPRSGWWEYRGIWPWDILTEAKMRVQPYGITLEQAGTDRIEKALEKDRVFF